MAVDMKSVIANKFIELSRTRSLDKISVKDLAEGCGISRQAFYYHFQDIMDVVRWMIHTRTNEVLKQSLHTSDSQEALKIIVTFFSENHELLKKHMESQKYQFDQALYQAMRTYLQSFAQHRRADQVLSHTNLEAALDFYAGGMVVMLLNYAGRSPEGDAQLTRQINEILNGKIRLFA